MMFLGLCKLGNICCGRKMFLNKIRNIFCVPDTKFVSATNVARAGKRRNICVGNNVSSLACTKTRNNETKRPKRNHRNQRNQRNETIETTEKSETTETSETAETKRPKYMKKLKNTGPARICDVTMSHTWISGVRDQAAMVA